MDSDSDSELKLLSHITELMPVTMSSHVLLTEKQLLDIIQIISLVRLLDLDYMPKPETKFMSLIIQIKSLFNSMDMYSQPKPLSELISRFTKLLNPKNPDSGSWWEFISLIQETIDLKPEPELVSFIYQLFSLVSYTANENLVFLCPRAVAVLGDENILYKLGKLRNKYKKWHCLDMKGDVFKLAGEEGSSYFLCHTCKGQNHQQHETATDEIKHPLHPKHSLKLVYFMNRYGSGRKCYCCDKNLSEFIFCCFACDFALNRACAEKPLLLSIDHPKWHEHPLALFSRTTSLICDVCALVDSTCPIYICPPCGFVVHRTCLDLPRVIRISRHSHRISFTPSFDQGSLSCGVCRKQVDNDFGGYSCIKSSCSYASHSKCATQRNVWDGKELEGVPEEIEEELEPFVRISDGIIQHFSHEHHLLRLDENTNRDYDDSKQCQACTNPIYSGNFYDCMQCDFILHEECANLSRKIHHPIHPHMLTLMGERDGVIAYDEGLCSVCRWICTTGFFYKCGKQGCNFKVHVQCGTISEPLVHGSHTHPLFLTSKPGERKRCSICRPVRIRYTNETFNCIECDFSLCFGCATIPQKVRYKHDKHIFSLFYGKEETSTMVSWCEVCEGKIDSEQQFYMCDKDCCVTLHVRCTIGTDLYMKLGSSWIFRGRKVEVLANNLHISRPFCVECRKRCTQKIVLKMSESIFCSILCADIFLSFRKL